ncbi:MAG: DUF2878 domain-containing protein [bacterium]|nr:DUF2878 domain-containing protein [bacterium]
MKNRFADDRLKVFINAIGYMVVWWGSVLAARNDFWWFGPLLAILFMSWHIASKTFIKGEFLVTGVIVISGFLFDSVLTALNFVEYKSSWGENAIVAPLWIGGIWLGFALTVNHSFKSILSRPIVAILLGLIGGPLTYRGAAGLGAISLTRPAIALITLGVAWGVMMWLMSKHAIIKGRR